MKIERVIAHQDFILEAILGARLSWDSGSKSDSFMGIGLIMGDADEALLRKLLGGVVGEDKFLRTIPVSLRITAPLKWWIELDTYNFVVKQSDSFMHYTKGKGELPRDRFTPDTDELVIKRVNELFVLWQQNGGGNNSTNPYWEVFQDSIPKGVLYTRHVFLNYASMRLMYKQRLNHRQADWREFCAWIETLPYSWLITQKREK